MRIEIWRKTNVSWVLLSKKSSKICEVSKINFIAING